MSDLKRLLMVAAGTCSVVLGVIGIFMPVLPTTPFLLLAAALYARSSPRFYRWLMNQKHLGPYLRNYREGRGIPLRTKAVTLGMLWLTIGSTAAFAVEGWIVRLLLAAVAIGVTAHIARVPTLRRQGFERGTSAEPTGPDTVKEDRV